MPKTFTAPFAQDPRTFDAVVTAPITNQSTDTPSGTVLVATAGANGAIVPRISATPRASLATAVGMVLFVSRDQGATQRPKGGTTVPAGNISPNSAPQEADFSKFTEQRPLRLGPGDRLYAGCLASPPAGGIVVHGEIVDF